MIPADGCEIAEATFEGGTLTITNNIPIRPITVFDFEEAIGERDYHVAIGRTGEGCWVVDDWKNVVFQGTPKEVLHWLRENP